MPLLGELAGRMLLRRDARIEKPLYGAAFRFCNAPRILLVQISKRLYTQISPFYS
jgi:hypothetical protein